MLIIYIIGAFIMGMLIWRMGTSNNEDKCTISEILLGSVLWFTFPLWLVFDKIMKNKVG